MSDHPKKLIEVALPLDEINAACKAYKDRKVGTIRNIHKWFAPMPLPAWRALIYAALIDDPGDDEKRAYHLDLMKRLVANGADLPDEATIMEARANLSEAFPEGLPLVIDPFCGGGSTLIEAQRLGLAAYASDFNPVPALISRALVDILPKVFGAQPIHTSRSVAEARESGQAAGDIAGQMEIANSKPSLKMQGFGGLAADVTYYANELRDRAQEQLSPLYPSSKSETVVAWLWAHTTRCPNPTCGSETILTTSWWLSKKPGDLAWITPQVSDGCIDLQVVCGQSVGEAPPSPKSGRGTFQCIVCGATLSE